MEVLISKIEKHLVPLAAKLNGQRHLAALRDGFIAIMPLMIIGAFAVMINSVFLNFSEGSLYAELTNNPIDPATYSGIHNFLINIMDYISKGSLNILGILAVGTVSYSLTKTKGYNGLEASVIAVAAYFITFDYIDNSSIAVGLFGSANLITGLIIAFFTAEVYTWCLKKDLRIKMPDTVPPAVSRSFSALIPATIILVILAVVQSFFMTFNVVPTYYESSNLVLSTGSISTFIQNVIGVPLHIVGGGLFGVLFYGTVAPFLWFFGIHGPNTLAFLDNAIFTPAAIQNAALINDGIVNYNGDILNQAAYDALTLTQKPSVYTKSFIDGYIMIGGAGTTLGLVIAMLIASKDKATKQVAKYSLGPALFNINEPLLFGLPIVFNPILFVPLVIIQPILIILTVILINIHALPMYSIPIPWTSPVGLGAFLAYGGSIRAMIWAFCCVAIATFVYYPFVIAMNRAKEAEASSMKVGDENE